MITHHGTIRKYTEALLDLFNNLEVPYTSKAGIISVKNVPISYASREKSRILEDYNIKQIKEGNVSVLPKAHITLSSMVKAESRIKNKYLKINTLNDGSNIQFQYNSVPYEFTYELTILCRGLNEASILMEQIGAMFNPTVNIDVYDGKNLDEPSRIPVSLLDIGFEQQEYDEFSTNLVTITCGLSIKGNMYQPIKTTSAVNNFKIFMSISDSNYYSKKSILGWDVQDGYLINGTVTDISNDNIFPPTIIDIVGNNVIVGDNIIEVIYSDVDNPANELTFQWSVLSGSGTISGTTNTATLSVSAPGDITIQVTITDVYGNFATSTKIFTV